jgi:hypothetical protein
MPPTWLGSQVCLITLVYLFKWDVANFLPRLASTHEPPKNEYVFFKSKLRAQKVEGGWKYNRGGELVQGTLYTRIELSQQSPLILLMYDNSKINFNFQKILINLIQGHELVYFLN